MNVKKTLLIYFILSVIGFKSFGQIDTSGIIEDTTSYKVDISNTDEQTMREIDPTGKLWIKRNPYKAIIAPIGLIGLGAILIKNPVYDRFDFKTDLNNAFSGFKGTKIDDYLIYVPYVELVALNLIKIKCQNDFINTSLLIVKAELINTFLTFGLKYLTNIDRPNGAKWAWPSGHTSQAFVAATIVNREFRYKSPWYGVAAYGIAGTVGLFRMLNNKHWLSDVVAGAGIGILSANLSYITHKWKWGRPGTCFAPMLINGRPGVVFAMRF